MEKGKNIISNSHVDTGGGDFINGDNNFIQKIIINHENKKERLKGIIEQTKNVLNKIQSDISGIKLKRDLIELSITDLIMENQFIFIDGEAGCGKSAYAKQILESLEDTCIISFAADQFLKSSLINTLHEINVDLSLEEIFNEFNEFSYRLIYIDSFEKLLEGEAEAFRELLSVLRHNKNIKLVVSCRSYALETLKINYFDKEILQNNSKVLNVPELTDEELNFFVKNIPALKNIVLNVNLREIIRVPKYLALSHKLVSIPNNDLCDVDIVAFKNKLWKYIVGGTNGVLEQKRQNVFIDIAVKRAKNLTLLTSVNEFDSDLVYALKSDGILFEENNLYAPSHDIFEDWGLIKYINLLKINSSKTDSFYRKLSNEPAIRRGFRLWVESKIEESESWIYNFVSETINDDLIENHWKDEVLIAVIKSNLCGRFFAEFKLDLLEKNLQLLKRMIHLLRISGKDSNECPNTSGWDVLIIFLHNNLDEVINIDTQILRFLYDWKPVLTYRKVTDKKIPEYVGKMVYKLLGNFKSYDDKDSLIDEGIKLLYQLSEYIPNEIREVFKDLLIEDDYKDKRGSWKRKRIQYALSFFYSGTLPKYFYNELVELANFKWKKRKIELDDVDWIVPSRPGIDEYFGITNRYEFDYFPESTYQTFVYGFLNNHPLEAVDFIIDFSNYCVENFIKSDFLKSEDGFGREADDLVNIELFYNDNVYSIKGSTYLWMVNRGGQVVVPDLLQSVVIALERFMYELGKHEVEGLDKILQVCFDKIYTKSNSVILISVLSSIAMAYPKKVGDMFLPLLSDRKFFDWDSKRWARELVNGESLLGLRHSTPEKQLYNEERREALKWKHRMQYHKGLVGFVLQYQISYGNLNGRIFGMLDRLETKCDKNDIYYLKLLSEIDIRKQNVEQVEHNGQKAIQLSPNYSVNSSLEQEMIANEKEVKIQNIHAKYTLWVTKMFQKKAEDNITYEYWKECLEYFNSTDYPKTDILYLASIDSFPVATLAAIGIDEFNDKLSDDEFNFCIDRILEISNEIYSFKKEYPHDLDFSINIYDNQSALNSLPKLLLYKERLSDQQQYDIKNSVFVFLRDIDVNAESNMEYLYSSFREYVWDVDYQFAFNCFVGIFLYSSLNKRYPIDKRYSSEEVERIEKEEQEILRFIENDNVNYNFENLSYLKYCHKDLDKVLKFFPTHKVYSFSFNFLKEIFSCQIESYSYKNSKNKSSYYYDIGLSIQEVIVDFLLNISFDSESNSLCESIIDAGIIDLNTRENRKVVEYIERVLQRFISVVDSSYGLEYRLENFWKCWNVLYFKVYKKIHQFNKEFLFYSGFWKPKADDWFVLRYNNMNGSYYNMINKLDYIDISALIQLLSGIGFQSLNPKAIRILVKHLKINKSILKDIDYYYMEELIIRCFRHKLKEIKEDDRIVEDFLWLLNLMIDLGSSQAYYIRESLILYKKTTP
ncbi:MAG: hypothetical protein LBE34_04915 [Flavobacteriaceae bacterium]|nr:hypothetical protein [Flavobacteriaceae bacterium]